MTSFTAPPAQWPLRNYTFIETLHQGLKTTVYRAVQTDTQQSVIIKILSQEYPNPSQLVQFRNQYTIAKNLPIAGIIHPLSLEPWGNGYGLVMEDMGGIALSQYVRQHSLSIADILSIAIQLTDILHQLHHHRIIHKDIKPANILIHPESKQVKLIDFSIASLLPKETQAIQNPNHLEGTLAYLAPEQTGRMNRGIDYRTDFYGLGISLYQLLTSQLPFTSNDPLELIYCHIAQQPVKLDLLNPGIPAVVAAIVAKLMAKNAEDRYQSALGLKYDLEQCLIRLEDPDAIAEFSLGQRDLSDRFLIPEKLYGRDTEVNTLLDAFDRVSQGSSELMLVAGFSCIGKTAIVNEVHKPIARQRGYFIKGKFEQFNREIPFSAFVQAFRDLMGQLLSTSDTVLHTWKVQILNALENSAQVMIDLIPELENILGSQPPVPKLTGVAAQNRFNRLFQKFIQVFSTPDHPLVIFIDDLQWADAASLNLIQVLMAESQAGYLLLLGAYRENEIFPAHPLAIALEHIQQTGAPIHTITPQPLDLDSLKHLIADTLHCQTDTITALAELVKQKTQGNPFFATQFLKTLHQDGLITFESGQWQFDIDQIRGAAMTDDVVKLMVSQLQKMPENTQEILSLAACIGAQFDLATLATVSEQPHIETAVALWKALQAGFIFPTSQIYKFFQGKIIPSNNRVNPGYRFVHDRIQQAAYSLIAPENTAATHWHVGMCLWQSEVIQQDDKTFALVNQLNLGRSIVTEPEQIKQLAQLNLQAAQKAKLSAAHKSAQAYCEIGISMLLELEDIWETDHELMYGLHYHGSEAAYLSGQFERAETLYTSVLEHAKTPLEQAVIYRAQMTQYQLQGRNAEVIALQHKSNQLLGWSMPTSSDEIQQSLDAEIEIVAQFLAHRSIDSILELPKMTDATIQEMLRILQILFYAAWLDGQPTLALLALAKMTTLSLHHGNSEMSPFGYVGYGLVANIVIKDVDQAYQFGYTAVQLCDQFDNPDVRGMTNFLFAADVHSWKRPLREADSYYENAYKYGMEAGNWLTVSFMMMISGSDRLTYGKTLEEFYPIVEAHVAFLKKIKSLENLDALTVGVLQPIRQLLGLTHSWSSFDDENFSEANYLGKYRDTPYHLAWFYSVKIRHAYLFEQVDSYLDLIPQANIVENTIPTHAKTPSTVFYVVLMHLALIETVSEPTEHWRAVQQLEAKLAHWGNDCPENISHKLLLIGAEKARLQGHMATAIDCYDQSIAQAQEQGYGYEAALANELAAKFYLQWGKKNVAAGYMQDAYYAYYRWGATAKLTDLETRYTQLLRPILKQSTPTTEVLNNVLTLTSSSSGSTYTSNHSSSSNSGLNETIDLKTVLKVSQLLAGTIQLKDLLKRLTEIILQNSGADHCALLLPAPNGTWQLRARATLERTTLCTTRLEDCVNLPVNLIHYVKNTRKTVILNTPEAQLPVADTYLNQQRPASIMCSPLLNQGNMLGIVFLSNQYTREVFHRDRTAILALLCSQAAISLENARLFVESQETEAALRESQQQMQKTANSLPGLIYQFQIDVGGQASFTYISERSAEILEFGPDILQQTADPMLQCIHLDDLPTFQQAVKESMENLTPFMWIGRLNLPSGQQRWIEARSMPSRQADGSHLWDGVILDVSARKAAEQSLTASESKFRRLLSNLDGVVYRCQNDENWTMEFMSDAITALSGYPVSDFINNQKRAYASIIHPDDIDFVGDVVVQGLEERQAFAVEYRIVHQDGSIRWVTEKGKGISGEMGELQYLEGVILDISDRKAAEQKLLESQTFLKTVLDTFPLAVFWKDRESRFLGANQNFAQDAGFEEAEEMVGLTDFEMPWSEAESRASRADDRDVMVSDTPKLGIVETQTQTDGTQIWLETNKLPLHNLDGQVIGVLGTYQDISDRKQAEAAVLQKSAALEAAVDQLQNTQLQMVQSEKMATLGNLVAGVAHEINNPIGFLKGSINNLNDYLQDLVEYIEAYQQHQPPKELVQQTAEDISLEFVLDDLPKLLNSMKGATNRIKGISTSLRTFSRADTENKVSVNLHEGLDSTLLILKYRLKGNDQRPAIEISKHYGTLPDVSCFPGQLNQVFMNILANAIDALDEASHEVSFADLKANPHRITIRTELNNQQVRIAIRDNGPGIPEVVRHRIFDHLFTTKGVGKGTGLGLAIARQIVVETHGGNLEVQSAIGQGTEFCICLPVQ